jgi:hypothetical protein
MSGSCDGGPPTHRARPTARAEPAVTHTQASRPLEIAWPVDGPVVRDWLRVHQLPETEVNAERGGQDEPRIGNQAVVVNAVSTRSRVWGDRIERVLLLVGLDGVFSAPSFQHEGHPASVESG